MLPLVTSVAHVAADDASLYMTVRLKMRADSKAGTKV